MKGQKVDTRKTRVYVAGPITKGDQFKNVNDGIRAGENLSFLGYVPFIPHLTCFWHLMYPEKENAFWYDYDNHWLDLCDCLLRLPGESPGGTMEVGRMVAQGKPVYYSIEQLIECEPVWRDN